MQSAQTSLKRSLTLHTGSLDALKALEENIPRSSTNKGFMGKPRVAVSFSKEYCSPSVSQKPLQNQNRFLDDDDNKAKDCLSRVDDPLWKHVCRDIIDMMGPASLLKIWDSTLGEVCSQDQSIEIHCKTEKTSRFIQQYDFVILSSLQPYFPALKHLRVKTISTL